jgi:DEAD/DEAH box helicase domain-containing protein
MKNLVYFDLETQRSADEVGGWGNIPKMGMSVGVTYSTQRNGYRIYGENEVRDLIDELRRADLVVGFNHARFDYAVLQGCDPFFDAEQIPSLDLMLELQKTLKHRLSLDSIATASLGVEKTGDGMQALRWWREHERLQTAGDTAAATEKLLEIARYCCFDVKITRLVHEYGRDHRQLFYTNNFGAKLSVPVGW